MLDNFIPMATYRGDEGWLSWWTVFFWGWFLGYGPMMAIFIARISRGRTIRQVISTISIVAPLTTCFWFTIVGGSGLAFEIADPGSVSTAFEGFNLPGALLCSNSTTANADVDFDPISDSNHDLHRDDGRFYDIHHQCRD